MARYLAVSGRVITSYDMRGLGLVSYIVEDEPHFLLARALAESFSERSIPLLVILPLLLLLPLPLPDYYYYYYYYYYYHCYYLHYYYYHSYYHFY